MSAVSETITFQYQTTLAITMMRYLYSLSAMLLAMGLIGTPLLGTTESKFSFGDGKTLKMTVTPKMVTDTPFTNAPFDTFPVHCPDDVVWGILNEVGRSR